LCISIVVIAIELQVCSLVTAAFVFMGSQPEAHVFKEFHC